LLLDHVTGAVTLQWHPMLLLLFALSKRVWESATLP
jgi:hypothetical protein